MNKKADLEADLLALEGQFLGLIWHKDRAKYMQIGKFSKKAGRKTIA